MQSEKECDQRRRVACGQRRRVTCGHRRRAAFDQFDEKQQKTLKTPSRISEDLGQFSKIMATGMRETFEKKVQKITFENIVLEWFKRC